MSHRGMIGVEGISTCQECLRYLGAGAERECYDCSHADRWGKHQGYWRETQTDRPPSHHIEAMQQRIDLLQGQVAYGQYKLSAHINASRKRRGDY